MSVNKNLTKVQYEILSLLLRPQSGIDLAVSYEETFSKGIPMGTLYSALRRLGERGYLGVCPPKSKSTDQRYRTFKLKAKGVKALNLHLDHCKTFATKWSQAAARR